MKQSLTCLLALCTASAAFAKPEPLADYLYEGRIQQGVNDYTQHFVVGADAQNPPVFGNQERMSFAALYLFSAIEGLSQDMHRLGFGNEELSDYIEIPLLNLASEENQQPELATPEAILAVFERFSEKVSFANKLLEGYDEKDFSLALDVTQIRLDFNGDGQATQEESMLELLVEGDYVYNPEIEAYDYIAPQDREFEAINWDRSDLIWLKGYTHLLLATTDIFLAHDWGQVHEQAAHLFFARVDTLWGKEEAAIKAKQEQRKKKWLEEKEKERLEREAQQESEEQENQESEGDSVYQDDYGYEEEYYDGSAEEAASMRMIVDLIATAGRFSLPVSDPERLQRAHGHLLAAVKNSRVMWESILAETDDEMEWIPHVKQSGFVEWDMEPEEVDAWMKLLDEVELILEGKKLIPYWRFEGERGINLKKVFYEPRNLDLILWIQGGAALPYLEEGEVSGGASWEEVMEVFGDDLFFFAFWVN